MLELLFVGVGGFLGAIARHGVSSYVSRYSVGSFPLGTFAVNLLGCFLIGLSIAFVEGRQGLSPNVRLFLVIGLLGSFTTFSTFSYETFELLRLGNLRPAMFNVVLSAALGLVAVAAGRSVLRWIA